MHLKAQKMNRSLVEIMQKFIYSDERENPFFFEILRFFLSKLLLLLQCDKMCHNSPMNQCCSADFTAVIHIRRFKMVLLCERLDHLYVAVCHKLKASGKSSVAIQLLAKVVSSEIFFMPRDFLRCRKNSFQKGMCLLSCLSLYGR